MTTTADFYDLLMPELPGITTAMLDLHLRETAREFCHKTSAWRQDLTAINLVANQSAYALPMPVNAELVRITRLVVASELLWEDKERDDRYTQSVGGFLPKYQRNEPPFMLSDDLSTITLIAAETSTASLTAGMAITAALKPTATAAALPDFLKSQYSDAMRHGTLSRLMMMGKKPWGDRPLATEYQRMYQQDLNFAAYQGQVGNTRQPLRVKSWG